MKNPDPLAEQVMRNELDRLRRARTRKPSMTRPKPRGKEMPWNEDLDFSEMKLYLCENVRKKLAKASGEAEGRD